MYKDRFDVANTKNADTKVEDSEYVELTDISNFNVCKFIQNDQEVTQDELNTPGNAWRGQQGSTKPRTDMHMSYTIFYCQIVVN